MNYSDEILNIFGNMHQDFHPKIFSKLLNPADHPMIITLNTLYEKSLLNNINSIEDDTIISPPINTPVATTQINEKRYTADEIFSKYIIEFYSQTNQKYFHFLTKFVVLFRECINHFKKAENINIEYTQEQGAEQVPDLCNEFITEFMEGNDNFMLETSELIEIIQHFCNWLYEGKFTTSRLTLLG